MDCVSPLAVDMESMPQTRSNVNDALGNPGICLTLQRLALSPALAYSNSSFLKVQAWALVVIVLERNTVAAHVVYPACCWPLTDAERNYNGSRQTVLWDARIVRNPLPQGLEHDRELAKKAWQR